MFRAMVGIPELRSDEKILSSDYFFINSSFYSLADLDFVEINRCAVDQAITTLYCSIDDFFCILFGYFPSSKSYKR
jgi:hypothetical protein